MVIVVIVIMPHSTLRIRSQIGGCQDVPIGTSGVVGCATLGRLKDGMMVDPAIWSGGVVEGDRVDISREGVHVGVF